MRRSISGLLLVASLAMSVSAHAGGYDWRAAQRQQRQHADEELQAKQVKAEQAAKQSKKLAEDNKERTERLLKSESTKQSASPFVRASRNNAAWDNRGLGLATRESTIRPGTSIYQRLHTAPQSMASSLRRTYQMSFIHSMLLKRTDSNPLATLDLHRVTSYEVAILRAAGDQERRREYERNRPSRSLFAMLRVR